MIRVERVRVSPDGPAPWQVVGAQSALSESCLAQWEHDDWAWTTLELLTFLRRSAYDRTEVLVAIDPAAVVGDPRSVVGVAVIELPLADNTTFAALNLTVCPGYEDRAVDAALLDAALELAAAEGRSTVLLETDHLAPGPGEEVLAPRSGVGVLPADPVAQFVLARGFVLEQVERISTFHFPADDGARLADLRVQAAAHAGPDYAVHSWQGPTPEHRLDALAVLIGRMSTDAPMAGIDYAAEVWDAGRVRDRDAERATKERGSLTVVVEHVPTGELAAFTECEWPLVKPEVAYQHDTLVAGPHRGRRLGLLLKTTQLLELARVRPQLRRLHTWNAAENQHMLGINDAVGFEVTGWSGEWQLISPSS